MNQPPTLSQLKDECHRMLDRVARRPGAMKLLLGVQRQLQLFAGYKANRRYSPSQSEANNGKKRDSDRPSF